MLQIIGTKRGAGWNETTILFLSIFRVTCKTARYRCVPGAITALRTTSGRSARLAASLIIFTALANSGAKAESHQSFANWKAELRVEALAKGISAQTFDTAFVGVKPIERVIELDRSQPEFTLTLETYLNKVVSATRVKKSPSKTG